MVKKPAKVATKQSEPQPREKTILTEVFKSIQDITKKRSE